MILWIGDATAYDIAPVLADLPEVMFCSTGARVAYEVGEMLVEENMLGAYDL